MKTRRKKSLDQAFWSDFAKRFWEKKPLVIRNVDSSLLEIDETQIFSLLVRYADRCRRLKNVEGFKFYIDGQKQYEDEVLQLLPRNRDKSLLGYHARMNALFSDYCLVCDELLQVNLDKQALLNEFTDDLYRHVGFPNRFAEMGLYLGNYRKTPFGVHVDGCGVFSFPVIGQKQFRLWRPEFVKRNPQLDRAFQYAKFNKNSKVLVAGPGDMTYWPSSAWHIAESDGSFNATWSLGVWVDHPLREIASKTLIDLFSQKIGVIGDSTTTPFPAPHRTDGRVEQLPNLMQQSMDVMRTISPSEMHDAFLIAWMTHLSKKGFKTTPGLESSEKVGPCIRLRNDRSKVLWLQSKEQGGFYFSFGGILVDGGKSRRLLKLIQTVNAEEKCVVSKFIDGKTKVKDLECLRRLMRAGAFVSEATHPKKSG